MNNITINFKKNGENSIITYEHTSSIVTSNTPTVLSDNNSIKTAESKKIKALITNEIMSQMA